jgi:membrane-bound lytic murein transglycosylase A
MWGAALVLAALTGCAPQRAVPPAEPALALAPVAFDVVPGWSSDRLAAAIPAFLEGCEALAKAPADQKLGGQGEAAARGGTPGRWRTVCDAARAVPPGDEAAARAFFTQRFQAWSVADASARDRFTGLFTGYYEPEVPGSRSPGGAFTVPLRGRPGDIVQADLGAFADDLKGRKVAGRVDAGRFVPYFDRREIEAGALDSRHLEFLWLSDPVDAFFLQIQGSGRVRLADARNAGRVVRVTYAGQNGRPYVPIGRVLADRGAIPRDQVSMQSIRAWLTAHPNEAAEVMDQNPSYVFFRELTGVPADRGPPGALGAALTPGRSIAVDQRFIPLGAPVFVSTTDPIDGTPIRRLMVAQDLGGAIKGPVRADLFFGWTPEAEEKAGRMRQPGTEFLLLPR